MYAASEVAKAFVPGEKANRETTCDDSEAGEDVKRRAVHVSAPFCQGVLQT